MATATAETRQEGFGETARKDPWWAGPLAVIVGLGIFIVYSTWAGMEGRYFEIRARTENFTGPEVAPYLSPFYSPLLYDAQSPHRWFHRPKPSWWPEWFPFSAAMLILAGPGLFRLTCYYYRKAYYRAFWGDPPACAVGEWRKSYWGENHWPLLLQNAHRYTLYIALIILIFLWIDVFEAFRWPVLELSKGQRNPQIPDVVGHQFGMGLGTLIMLINAVLLTGFTFGCNSLRSLVGGRQTQFACYVCPAGAKEPVQKLRPSYHAWRFVTYFNNNHMAWAWVSLFSVGFADLYIRLCAMGIWKDVRFF
jgi:hypothetical protein